ncbi:MAG: polysaccharide deacetylase family protein [Clostridiales bacterium]|jgi:peptidoglycan/xylan/chitin deacetylase (PgdA/CDA1 family)|nr:polysaccharide deacetylase family protein [Clostridiales bacterium]
MATARRIALAIMLIAFLAAGAGSSAMLTDPARIAEQSGAATNAAGGDIDRMDGGGWDTGGAASDILIPRESAGQAGGGADSTLPGQGGQPGSNGQAGSDGQDSLPGSAVPDASAAPDGSSAPDGSAAPDGSGEPDGFATPEQIAELLSEDTLASRLVGGLLLYPNTPAGALVAASAAGAAASPYSGINAELFSGIMSGMASGLGDAISADADMQGNISEALSRNKKIVYFTVDDGPSHITRKFLDVFEAYSIRATFFVIGKNAEKYPDALREIYAKGHYIANHSYSHKYSELYASSESFFAELERWDEAVSNALGFGYHTGIFRFPAGSSYPKAQKFREPLLEKGYVYYDWNCLNGDAEISDRSADSLYDYMVETYRGRDEVVLLVHDFNTRQTTVDMLGRAIEFFRERHYEFRTLDQK